MNILSGLTIGQVLQRLGVKGANVVLTGTSAGNGPIHATISKGKVALKGWKKRVAGKVARGKFNIKLEAIPVGGPYSLRLDAGTQHVEIAPFFVGDVWILSGQSNMEGVGNMTGRAKPHPLVRSFSMRREWRLATEPLHLLAESPDLCHSAVQCSVESGEELRRKAVKGSGVGLHFAREMLERSGGVPQGLICVAHGGTCMRQWGRERMHLGSESLYASMLASVRATGQPVAGLLWYQGESDSDPANAAIYTGRMKKLVADTRRDLRQPRLPWVIVQIGRVFAEQANRPSWNSIQDQQRLLPEKIKFLETVPAVDLSMDDFVHVGSAGFPKLAIRLASAADRLVYGNKREKRGPQFRKIVRFDPAPNFALEVAFDFVQGGLQAAGEPSGFRLVNDTGAPLEMIYKTELKGNMAKLHLTKNPFGGFQLFYGHGFAPVCNITDARGFSLPVFGPIPIDRGKPKAFLPFITQWQMTDVVPAAKKLDHVSLSDVKALGFTAKSYPEQGFINEHSSWSTKIGHAFFHSRIQLSEPMQLEFLMGYDGPFRLWLDEKPFFMNMNGINPAYTDESSKSVKVPAGTHEIHVGMDINEGRAWGFFLRMARKDVTKAQLQTGDFAKPTYLV